MTYFKITDYDLTKRISRKKELTPEERIKKLEALNQEMEELRPYKKPGGLVLRF